MQGLIKDESSNLKRNKMIISKGMAQSKVWYICKKKECIGELNKMEII